MAQTYGEIVEQSFPEVFSYADEDTLFLDIGSGRGLIVAASVQEGGCSRAVGVEKYKEKFDESQELHASLPALVQEKVQFLFGDFNDSSLTQMLLETRSTSVLIFCNNLAFNQGTTHRSVCHCLLLLDHVWRSTMPRLYVWWHVCSSERHFLLYSC
jgi:hypothetical protein